MRGMPVVKLVMLFKRPADEEAFEIEYVRNLALIEKLPGIVRRQANMVIGSPAGQSLYYRVLEVYFEDFDALDAAMTSKVGVVAGQQLMKTIGDLVELFFVDVFEDDRPVELTENQKPPVQN